MESLLLTYMHTFNTKRKPENIASRKIIQNRHQQTKIWKINRTFPKIYIHKYMHLRLCWWWTLYKALGTHLYDFQFGFCRQMRDWQWNVVEWCKEGLGPLVILLRWAPIIKLNKNEYMFVTIVSWKCLCAVCG